MSYTRITTSLITRDLHENYMFLDVFFSLDMKRDLLITEIFENYVRKNNKKKTHRNIYLNRPSPAFM